MKQVPVLIAGGGPVGMTLGCELSRRGIACLLVERNPTTTRHPKMDITNARSMELFRRLGVVDALRAVAVPETSNFDVSWITHLTGHELHRFRYPSVSDWRRLIRERNDGSMPAEPPMRVSQVEIEPVLQRAVQAAPMVEARWGVELQDLSQDRNVVIATLRTADGTTEKVCCRYLVGCDGGTSRVRDCVGIRLEGQWRVQQRFLTHFRSSDVDLLQRWGIAWHYQSPAGTLIAQNDKDIWTLQTRWPQEVAPEDVDVPALLRGFAGRDFVHEILVANAWTPHFVVAERYGEGRVLLAGDAVHQYVPTGGYGMNTGIGDACDRGWKLAAMLHGYGGPRLRRSGSGYPRRSAALRSDDCTRGADGERARKRRYGRRCADLRSPGTMVHPGLLRGACERGARGCCRAARRTARGAADRRSRHRQRLRTRIAFGPAGSARRLPRRGLRRLARGRRHRVARAGLERAGLRRLRLRSVRVLVVRKRSDGSIEASRLRQGGDAGSFFGD
jgi:2-polyprenyl-6-methoxyphenol hydroxylase-like FAD-dependent oxidoreductase